VKIEGLDMSAETLAISQCALNSKALDPKKNLIIQLCISSYFLYGKL
jgi:hypothetical protein